jgi:sugar-specific transcriptional regulator TrmB
MDASLLEQIGLNTTQARAYLALISNGTLTPPQLSDKIQITRTNAYEVFKQLEDLTLAVKSGSGTKLTYRPENPSNLEKLMESRRNQVIEHETHLRSFMPQLMTYFYTYSEQPGARVFTGVDGLRQIYEDILRTRQTLYMIRTPAEKITLGKEIVKNFIHQRIKLGIRVESITPYRENANKDPRVDAVQLFTRTFFPADSYSAPVEIDIYGHKVAFLSFGDELTGVIIESPQIAEAMRSLFLIAKVGADELFRQRDDLVKQLQDERRQLGAPPADVSSAAQPSQTKNDPLATDHTRDNQPSPTPAAVHATSPLPPPLQPAANQEPIGQAPFPSRQTPPPSASPSHPDPNPKPHPESRVANSHNEFAKTPDQQYSDHQATPTHPQSQTD